MQYVKTELLKTRVQKICRTWLWRQLMLVAVSFVALFLPVSTLVAVLVSLWGQALICLPLAVSVLDIPKSLAKERSHE